MDNAALPVESSQPQQGKTMNLPFGGGTPDSSPGTPGSTLGDPAEFRPVPLGGTPSVGFAGERILDDYKKQGYALYLAAGIGGVGKTQLLDAFQKTQPFLRPSVRGGRDTETRVVSTAQGSFSCYPVKVGTRRAVFVDAAGEDFRTMYPSQRPSGVLSEAEARFLRLVATSLSGLILMVDLNRLWGEIPGGIADPGDRHQERILAWILEMLRWFRFDGRYDAKSAIPFQDQVDAGVKRLSQWQRLRFPVQVIFSKADELLEVPLPARAAPWIGKSTAARTLYPVGEQPLLLAYHHLPLLYSALQEHVRHFRFDFAHSLVFDPEDHTPCGVIPSLAWVLQRGWGLAPGTDTWVRLQRGIDAVTFRGARWKRLPEPQELPRG